MSFVKEGTKKMQFSEICSLYLREKRLEGVKVSTLSNYTYTIESLFLPYLTNLSEANFYRLIEYLLENFARKTMIDKIILLNDILRFAYNKKLILETITLPVPKENRKKIEIFNDSEKDILQGYLIRHLDFFHFGVLLCLFTGLRVGELAALQKKHIQNGLVTIKQTLQRVKNFNHESNKKTVILIDAPKTHCSMREIPLLDDLSIIFENLYSNLESDCYILTGTRDYMEPRTIERRYKSLLEGIGINYKVFHTLRHTFATNCVKAGIDIKTLSEILGHASVKITLERYVHSDVEMKREAMKKLGIAKLS